VRPQRPQSPEPRSSSTTPQVGGVTLFYVTNRDADEEPATLRNLEALGFPVNSNPDTLLLRGKRPEWGSDKSSRRAFVAGTHRILLLIGDDINDFVAARDKTTAELDAIIDQTAAWWGTRWFVIPNPMYGTWERAVTGGTGTPCEQLQRKVEALRTEAP
jgi:5'-nucleotidase (lipoprotein e(P4) family)